MENTNQKGETLQTTETVGVTETKLNAPSTFDTNTQKKKLEAEKEDITAIYFVGKKRILTSIGTTYQHSTLELIRLQNNERRPITMIIVKELPLLEVSRDIADYEKYLPSKEVKNGN